MTLKAVDDQPTIEGLAESGALDPVLLEGDSDQLSFNVDFGKELVVSASTLKIKAPPKGYETDGEFQPGASFEATVKVFIDRVEFKPIRDRLGIRIGVERIHHAVIDGLERSE